MCRNKKQPMAALQLLYHTTEAQVSWHDPGSEWRDPYPRRKGIGVPNASLWLKLCPYGFSCHLTFNLREAPTVIAGHSWITCYRDLLWNLPQLMIQSWQTNQIQPVLHNSKFWLSHEEICKFNSLHCSLLFQNPFSGKGNEFFVWDSRGNVKHFFPQQILLY